MPSAKKDRRKKKRRPAEIYLFPDGWMRLLLRSFREEIYPFPFLFLFVFLVSRAIFIAKVSAPYFVAKGKAVWSLSAAGDTKKILLYIWEPGSFPFPGIDEEGGKVV